MNEIFSQHNHLSFSVNYSDIKNHYKKISGATLSYQYSFFNNILQIGPYFKYYRNVIKGSSLQVPDAYSGYKGYDNGIGYGLTAIVSPLDSNSFGTKVLLPYLIFNIGLNSGYINADSDKSGVYYRVLKQKAISGFGIGIMLSPFYSISLFSDFVYEIRNPYFEYRIFIRENGSFQTEEKTINLSSFFLKMGIRINF